MAIYMWREKIPDRLCFTAEQANSTVTLNKTWTPTSVNLETSTDKQTWTDYTIWNTITLTNIGDKVYWRNKSETDTSFSTSLNDYYRFVLTGLVWASGEVGTLLCKNSTDTISKYAFNHLFYSNSSLTKVPKLPAPTIWSQSYYFMFRECTNLTQIPSLPAIDIQTQSYDSMFWGCSKIKLSSTQTWDYTQPYRIPTEWTGTTRTRSLYNMFASTWWSFTGEPTVNTTYYVHKDNTIV